MMIMMMIALCDDSHDGLKMKFKTLALRNDSDDENDDDNSFAMTLMMKSK